MAGLCQVRKPAEALAVLVDRHVGVALARDGAEQLAPLKNQMAAKLAAGRRRASPRGREMFAAQPLGLYSLGRDGRESFACRGVRVQPRPALLVWASCGAAECRR